MPETLTEFYAEIAEHNAKQAEYARKRGIAWREIVLAKPHLLDSKTRTRLRREVKEMRQPMGQSD